MMTGTESWRKGKVKLKLWGTSCQLMFPLEELRGRIERGEAYRVDADAMFWLAAK